MASTYLSRTLGTPTNAYKGTLSWWQKGMNTSSTNYIFIAESGNERFLWYGTSGRFQGGLRGTSSPPDIDFSLSGTPYFRDTSGWYHCVLAWDSTQGTASDRIKYYVNGVQYTVSGSGTSGVNDIPQNHVMPMNKNGLPFRIGSTMGGGSYFDGIMSHIHFCDGTQYQASDFGSTDATTGEWKINTSPNVNYGNNGFWWLKDTNAATDSSPNSNTPSISGTLTKTEDNPSNVFPSFGNGNIIPNNSTNSFSNGGLSLANSSAIWQSEVCPFGFSAGKYYWEIKLTHNGGDPRFCPFVVNESNCDISRSGNNVAMFSQTGSYGFHSGGSGNADIYANGSNISSSYSALSNFDASSGTIAGFAIDCDNKRIYLSVNGTWQNSANPSNGTNPYDVSSGWTTGDFMLPAITTHNANVDFNFGNGYFGTTAVSSAGTNASGIGIFEYDVPTGFTALSTKGLNE